MSFLSALLMLDFKQEIEQQNNEEYLKREAENTKIIVDGYKPNKIYFEIYGLSEEYNKLRDSPNGLKEWNAVKDCLYGEHEDIPRIHPTIQRIIDKNKVTFTQVGTFTFLKENTETENELTLLKKLSKMFQPKNYI